MLETTEQLRDTSNGASTKLIKLDISTVSLLGWQKHIMPAVLVVLLSLIVVLAVIVHFGSVIFAMHLLLLCKHGGRSKQ